MDFRGGSLITLHDVLHVTVTQTYSDRGNDTRMLFIDYSSAFNTVVSNRLSFKIRALGLNAATLIRSWTFLKTDPW